MSNKTMHRYTQKNRGKIINSENGGDRSFYEFFCKASLNVDMSNKTMYRYTQKNCGKIINSENGGDRSFYESM